MATFTGDQAMQLLDFSQKLDTGLLDAVVSCFYNSEGSQVHKEPVIEGDLESQEVVFDAQLYVNFCGPYF